MASNLSIRGLLRPFSTMLRAPPTTTVLAPTSSPTRRTTTSPKTTTTMTTPLRRPFTTTPSPPARVKPASSKTKPNAPKMNTKSLQKKAEQTAAARRARRAAKDAKLDPKVANIMKFLYAGSQVRAPLRMARNRHLRHWTIHRAWLLLRRQRAQARERERMRLWQSMHHACERLRLLEGPGTRPRGYLFRKAMEKRGLWGMGAVPIEYARPLVETPPERPWNHEWKRA